MGDPSRAAGAEAPRGEGTCPDGSAESLGVQVLNLRRVAGGYMLDLRYRVLDPVQAADVVDRSGDLRLVDPVRGAEFRVPSPPKVGSLRQSTPRPERGRVYFALFANPGRFLRPGDPVTVRLGDRCRADVGVE